MIAREIAKTGGTTLADSPEKKEAVDALVSLGYGQAESLKAVNAVENIENLDSGAILKAALKKMF
jgi:Holliday junction resolvasome RuvABC DNA-binding subunit